MLMAASNRHAVGLPHHICVAYGHRPPRPLSSSRNALLAFSKLPRGYDLSTRLTAQLCDAAVAALLLAWLAVKKASSSALAAKARAPTVIIAVGCASSA
jgi:hypothetical protein